MEWKNSHSSIVFIFSVGNAKTVFTSPSALARKVSPVRTISLTNKASSKLHKTEKPILRARRANSDGQPSTSSPVELLSKTQNLTKKVSPQSTNPFFS